MPTPARYLRLMFALTRYGLARELSFRANFLAKMAVEVLWLGILLVFYRVVFARTPTVAGWSEPEYLFFVGCYFTLEGVLETFFLENCNSFADLVRSGDLDFYLLKPVDEQFLITCHSVEWSTAGNILMGLGVMVAALLQLDRPIDPHSAALFCVLFACGVGICYSLLVMLTASSVWLVRNQSLFELWWLFTTLMRYPREIFSRSWAAPLGWVFTFLIPVMVVVSVPAEVMVRAVSPSFVGYTLAATVALLWVSRRVFRLSLRRYRSASS
jgi:ABC-2 type transport system permease protein